MEVATYPDPDGGGEDDGRPEDTEDWRDGMPYQEFEDEGEDDL